MNRLCHSLLIFLPALLAAQGSADQSEILKRLEALEQQNRVLMEEIKDLRQQLSNIRDQTPSEAATKPEPTIEEKLEVQERRIEEQSQTKVEASQRYPISITGMALFNSFLTGRYNGGSQNPTIASLSAGPATSGATMRQTIIGLRYEGPQAFGATVRGFVMMDLFGGSAFSLNHLLRLRVAAINLDWKNQSLMVGQDKPLISPRDPDSFSQVGVSPLTNAGNLWLWQPQVRFEQRAGFGDNSGLRAQVSLYQTAEAGAYAPQQFAATLERARPALQGRFEVWRQLPNGGRIEIAPGFHTSTTHVAQTSVPSRLFTVDWLVQPLPAWKLTGLFYNGENAASMGTLGQGFTILGPGKAIPIHGTGGWAQLSYSMTSRATLHLMGGQHDDRNTDLRYGGISKNQAYAANVHYRIATNVFVGIEASQVRTTFLGFGKRLNNHYDLALAYLF